MKCKCGSYAINHNLHGRDGSEPELCDVCYWRKKAAKNQGAEPIHSVPDFVFNVIQQAKDSICAGGLCENRQHERSIVEPYIDGILDELRDLDSASITAQQPSPVRTCDRLPTKNDADFFGNVWWWFAETEEWEYRQWNFNAGDYHWPYWQPTGLSKPAEPGE